MRPFLVSLSFILLSSSAWAQSAPVCAIFTDADAAGVLGQPPTIKRPMLGPESDCLWSVPGLMLNVMRTIDNDPAVVKAVVDSRAKNAGRDVVAPEAGIGDAAVSVQGRYGRSITIAFRSGRSAWILNLEKVDLDLDTAAALPKLRALAKKAAAFR